MRNAVNKVFDLTRTLMTAYEMHSFIHSFIKIYRALLSIENMQEIRVAGTEKSEC